MAQPAGFQGLHAAARRPNYDTITRFPVPDEKVPWSAEFSEYTPVEYTAPSVLAKPVWADVPEDLP